MKLIRLFFLVLALQASQIAFTQSSNPVISLFPKGTILHPNIPYNNDTLAKHLLDIYLPPNVKGKVPLIVFIHGGGWLVNDKYADIDYMKNTVAEIVKSGFALASIDYRFATQATFPAQIQDCNRAVSFLYDHAEKYGFDKERFAVMGFPREGIWLHCRDYRTITKLRTSLCPTHPRISLLRPLWIFTDHRN